MIVGVNTTVLNPGLFGYIHRGWPLLNSLYFAKDNPPSGSKRTYYSLHVYMTRAKALQGSRSQSPPKQSPCLHGELPMHPLPPILNSCCRPLPTVEEHEAGQHAGGDEAKTHHDHLSARMLEGGRAGLHRASCDKTLLVMTWMKRNRLNQ